MTVTTMIGCIKKGPIAERPSGAAYLNDYLYYGTDTGTLDWYNGTIWVRLHGPDKAETYTNKNISSGTNTLVNVLQDPFVTSRREGYIIPSLTAAASVKGALKGFPTNGTYSYVYDSGEGYVSRFSSSIVENIGYISNPSVNIVARREWATNLKVRVKPSTTTATRLVIGFTSNNTLPTSDTLLGSGDSGVLVGFNTAATNFSVYRNDSSGVAPAADTFSAAKDAVWRTFDITMSDTNVVCTLDGANPITLTTRIPAGITPLYTHIQMQNTSATAKTFDIAKARFGSDLI